MTEDRKVYCNNCEWDGKETQISETLLYVNKLWDRLEPGEETPVGTCPECESMCYLTENKHKEEIDTEQFSGPQTMILNQIKRFCKIYAGDDDKVDKAIEAYEKEAPLHDSRFSIPVYCASLGSARPMSDAIRSRVWHKSMTTQDPGESRCQEFHTIREALMGRVNAIAEGYLGVSTVIGVGWDNAMGCFSEFQIKELVALYPEKD